MKIVKKSAIDWLIALDRLSVGAFYLLNVMYRRDIDITDNSLMLETSYGTSTHRKHKKELQECNYVESHQIGKGIYQYYIGELNG